MGIDLNVLNRLGKVSTPFSSERLTCFKSIWTPWLRSVNSALKRGVADVLTTASRFFKPQTFQTTCPGPLVNFIPTHLSGWFHPSDLCLATTL